MEIEGKEEGKKESQSSCCQRGFCSITSPPAFDHPLSRCFFGKRSLCADSLYQQCRVLSSIQYVQQGGGLCYGPYVEPMERPYATRPSLLPLPTKTLFATRELFHKSSFSHEIQNCVTSSVCPLAPGGPHLPCPLRPFGTHESYLHPDRMIGAV